MMITYRSAYSEAGSGTLVFPTGKTAWETQLAPEVARLCGLPQEFLAGQFSGNAKETLPLYYKGSEGTVRLFLLGLGDELNYRQVMKASRTFFRQNRERLGGPLGLVLGFLDPRAELGLIPAFFNGMVGSGYDPGRYKTEQEDKTLPLPDELVVYHPLRPELLVSLVEKGRITGDTQCRIMDLVNAPANKKRPVDLADWALASGQQHGYSVRVLDKPAIEREGMGALLGVNRGSEDPAVFIIMEYRPAGKAADDLPHVGLVGKGVTFDTGGLSIKPSGNMHLMKSDMGGAAAVLGTLELTARLGLPVRLTGIVPATDNSVDSLSLKPSDVITSYSGKTIEIIDTDAEGRLILADALSYMVRNYQPDILIDLATLTGSAVRTFGYHAAALFSSDQDLQQTLIRSGEETGERVWPLPLWKEYEEDLRSDVADVRNFSGKPAAGAITAAKFLEVFTDKHAQWAHLDIAGVAFNDTEFSAMKTATGYGIRLLTHYLESLSH